MYEYDLSSEKYRFVLSSKMSNWTEEDWKPQNVITLRLVSCRLLCSISMTPLFEHSRAHRQSYLHQVLQTIQMKLILLWVWAERAVLGRAKTALKFKYEI